MLPVGCQLVDTACHLGDPSCSLLDALALMRPTAPLQRNDLSCLTYGQTSASSSEGGFTVTGPAVGGNPVAIILDVDAIYIAGIADAGGNRDWRIVKRRRSTGELDTSFGNNGEITSSPSGADDFLRDLAFDGTYLYLAGTDQVPGSPQWRVEKRSAATGALVDGFSSGGVFTFDPVPGQNDNLNDIVLAGDYLFLFGSESTGGTAQQWRVERRSALTAEVDSSFATGGSFVQAAGNGTQSQAYSGIYDASFLYVGGGQRAATVDWRTEKRDLITGALVTGFGVGGQVDQTPSGGLDEVHHLALVTDSVVASGFVTQPSAHGRVDRYSTADGSLVSEFNGTGTVEVDVSGGSDAYNDMHSNGQFLFLAGTTAPAGIQLIRVEKRNILTGALDTAFDGDGVFQVDLSPGTSQAYCNCADQQYLYVASVDSSSAPARWRLDKIRVDNGTY